MVLLGLLAVEQAYVYMHVLFHRVGLKNIYLLPGNTSIVFDKEKLLTDSLLSFKMYLTPMSQDRIFIDWLDVVGVVHIDCVYLRDANDSFFCLTEIRFSIASLMFIVKVIPHLVHEVLVLGKVVQMVKMELICNIIRYSCSWF